MIVKGNTHNEEEKRQLGVKSAVRGESSHPRKGSSGTFFLGCRAPATWVAGGRRFPDPPPEPPQTYSWSPTEGLTLTPAEEPFKGTEEVLGRVPVETEEERLALLRSRS